MTKKEVLEFFGKDGKNVRALDRMLQKGMVVYEDGWYITRSEKKKEIDNSYKEKFLFLKNYLGELEWKFDEAIVIFYKWLRIEMERGKEDLIPTLDQFRNSVWRQTGFVPRVNKVLEREWDVKKKEKDTSLYGDDRKWWISVADGWRQD